MVCFAHENEKTAFRHGTCVHAKALAHVCTTALLRRFSSHMTHACRASRSTRTPWSLAAAPPASASPTTWRACAARECAGKGSGGSSMRGLAVAVLARDGMHGTLEIRGGGEVPGTGTPHLVPQPDQLPTHRSPLHLPRLRAGPPHPGCVSLTAQISSSSPHPHHPGLGAALRPLRPWRPRQVGALEAWRSACQAPGVKLNAHICQCMDAWLVP